MTASIDPRTLLRQMFDAAVASAQPALCLPPHLPEPPKGRTIVIGAGKASAAMARALEDHWPGPLEGLVVTRYGYEVPCERIEIAQAAHPVPDERSLAAVLNAKSGVMADIPAGASFGGYPAVPVVDWHRQTIALSRIIKPKFFRARRQGASADL